MSSKILEQTRGGDKRGIPDLHHIKSHVPIADVARALDIRVASNTRAHCWRPEGHEHGDRTPSVWFSRKSNKGKCCVCDRWMWSNIDLVQTVLSLSTAAAVNWIAERFNVPRIARRRPARNGIVVPAGRVGCGSPLSQLMRSGLFARLSHPTKALLSVFLEFCDDDTAELSYRTLQRVSGIGSMTTIKRSQDDLQDIGLLKIKPGHQRVMNAYRLTWDDANLQRIMAVAHETTSREVKAEMELKAAAREAAARRYLGNTSLHPVEHKNVRPLHPVEQSRKEGKAPKSAATPDRRKGATA